MSEKPHESPEIPPNVRKDMPPGQPPVTEQLVSGVGKASANELRGVPTIERGGSDTVSGIPRVIADSSSPLKNYEILRELGRGGMGVVYQARQTSLNRVVALKMILAGTYASEQTRQRFLREAKTAAAMQHPHIVQVFDLGDWDGQTYFAMEFIEGTDLQAIGAVPPRRAAELVEKVARAVHYAHQLGIIHRDLKPANVLLDSHGSPKVTDFGLAKLVEEGEVAQLTSQDQLLGTAPYMPPEQARGEASSVGPPADVYGLGAILYQLLTSQPPFLGRTTYQILQRVQHDEPWPPSRVVDGVDRDLETIVLKCLHKDPARRYATAAELADDLGRFLDGQPIQARRIGIAERTMRWVRRSTLAKTLLAVLLVAAAVGGWTWRQYELFKRPTTSFYRELVSVEGAPLGAGRLDAKDIRRRHVSLEFTTQGRRGPVTRVRSVHSSGHIVPASVLAAALHAGQHSFVDTTVACWTVHRDESGEITKIVASDRMDRELWSFIYTKYPTKGHYVDRYGNERSRTGTGATYMEIAHSEQGFVESIRYLDATSHPQANRNGVYGYQFQHDGMGRPKRITHVGPDGQPTFNDGFVHVEQRYDTDGNLREIIYLDSDEQPTPNRQGITQISYNYDAYGNQTEVIFGDGNGQAIVGVDGYARVKRTIDGDGNVSLEHYCDASGAPTPFAFRGMACVRRDWGKTGLLTGETYLDVVGQPVTTSDGYAAIKYEYDDFGNLIRRQVFDPNGAPTVDKHLVHCIETQVDDDGRVSQYAYFNAAGEPTMNLNGWSRVEFGYDSLGNRNLRRLLDTEGRPTLHKDGYAEWRGRYDRLGNLVHQSYYGVDGQPVMGNDGYASTEAIHDDQGNLISEWFLDMQGQPTVGKDGWHQVKCSYDDHHCEIERRYFDTNGDPTWHPDGYSYWTAICDPRGNVLEKRYFDVDGQPTRTVKGYAHQTNGYDNRGVLTEEAFFDEQGDPTPGSDGAARVVWQVNAQGYPISRSMFDTERRILRAERFVYDRFGNLLELAYLDGSGQPREQQGVARLVKVRDERGQEIEERFYDAQANKTRKDGVFRQVYQYDEQGRLTEQRCYDEHDQLALHELEGFARVTNTYDQRGNLIRKEYYDTQNRLFINPIGGYAIRVSQFDEWRNCTEFSLFGIDGKPILGSYGYHACRQEYDRGEPVEYAFFGLNGEPVMSNLGFSRKVIRYNHRLLPIESALYDTEGNLVTALGWGREFLDYDGRGNVIRAAYVDASGNPALGDWGYAYETREYDAWNRPVASSVFDSDDRPVLRSPEGYWRMTRKYDQFGNVRQERYFGVDGQPLLVPDGNFAEWMEQFTPNGSSQGRQYFDEQGNRLSVRVTIASVVPGSIAEQLGIQPGDVIQRFNDEPVTDMRQFLFLRSEASASSAAVWIDRDGMRVDLDLPTGMLGINMQDVIVRGDDQPN